MNEERIKQCKADIAKLYEELERLQTPVCPPSYRIGCTVIGVNPDEKLSTGKFSPIRIKAANTPCWRTHDGTENCHTHTIAQAKGIVNALNEMITFCEENYD